MRLTQMMKDAFVNGILADVPEVDYGEQIRKIATDDLMKQVPTEVLILWDDPKLKGYVSQAGANFGRTPKDRPSNGWLGKENLFHGVQIYGIPSSGTLKLSDKAQRKVNDLGKKALAQQKEREQLRIKLKGLTLAYITTQTMAKAVPEFAKYLPAEHTTDRSVPVVANVVTSLMKAGWPKKKSAKPQLKAVA